MKNGGLIAAMAVFVMAAAPARAGGDAEHGRVLYAQCQICHQIAKNSIGPRHLGLFGRKAGSLPDYNYSTALKNSGIVWNEPVSYTHLRAHETGRNLVCRLLL